MVVNGYILLLNKGLIRFIFVYEDIFFLLCILIIDFRICNFLIFNMIDLDIYYDWFR